ncbi:MAG: cation-translocating P-type ATPase [Ignavibacteriales bacterium]
MTAADNSAEPFAGTIADAGPKPHSMAAGEVLQALETDPHSGLTTTEALARLERFGANELQKAPKPGLFARLIEQFSDTLVLILLGATVVSAILGEYVDAVVILAIVVLNAVIGIVQEYKAEEALESLERMAAPNALVVRGGEAVTIPAKAVVAGDIVVLHAGDKIPADLRLVESLNLQTDESPLTGESTPVEKDASAVMQDDAPIAERVNMAYFGTAVTYGRGKGVVVATGMNTEIGHIAGAIQQIEAEKTPLQQNLTVLGKVLGVTTSVVCGMVFVLGVIRDEPLLEMFLTSVSLAVAAIPEGLPAVVTIVLAIGVKRMADKHVIVRKLSAVETLGSTTVICSDKTGTLTQNQMTVVRVHAAGRTYHVTGKGYRPYGEFVPSDQGAPGAGVAAGAEREVAAAGGVTGPDEGDSAQGDSAQGDAAQGAGPVAQGDLALAALLIGGALNNDSALREKAAAGPNSEPVWEIIGDPTEGALVVAAAKAGLYKDTLDSVYERVAEIPFDSSTKRMSTVHRLGDGRYIAWVKGAPEVVLGLCDKVVVGSQPGFAHRAARDTGPGTGGRAVSLADLESGLRISSLSEDIRQEFNQANLDMASDALRVIGVGYKILTGLPAEVRPEEIESGLTMVGLLGMADPPRAEVPAAMDTCRRAGIIPVMITGDHQVTAMAVGKELGMTAGKGSMSGRELSETSDERLQEVAEDIRVYARVSPEDKFRIVQALKGRGHIVAMTGDGVNDAPALKRSDIGVAMGITGTDVAKETSDMILTDDNFSSIVAAVEEGRIIYSNIVKFVVYLLSCNVGEVLTIFASMVANLPIPLRPVHLLWLNLVTDSLPALALGVERGGKDIMNQPPRNPKEHILTRKRWTFIGVQAVLLATVCLAAFVWGLNKTGVQDRLVYGRTMALTALVSAELLRAFSARSETESIVKIGLLTNRAMLGANAISFLLLVMAVEVPILRGVFDTASLGVEGWSAALALAVIPALGAESLKGYMRPRPAEARDGDAA